VIGGDDNKHIVL